MARTMAGSIGTPAVAALTAADIPFTLRPYPHDDGVSSFGLEAAAALGVEPERVFKTLMASVEAVVVVAVVPVSGSLDLKALAHVFGKRRAVMADPAVARRRSGYVLGGISPLGQRQRSPVVIDETVMLHATVFVSGGRRGLDIELAPTDLIVATQARTAPIAGA